MRKKAAQPTAAKAPYILGRRARPVNVSPAYIDRREAAVYLGLSVEKLIELVHAGAIPEIIIGNACRRIAIADLDAFARARRVTK